MAILVNIICVYLSNGKSYTVYMQTNGSYSGWDISGTKVDNLGGGCSIFAPSSVLSYMLGIDVFDIRQTIRGAGNFYGLEQLCYGKVAINVDGKNFVLKTELSEKKEYEGEVLSKDEVLKDWQNTVDAGGCIILNVSARNDSYVHLQTGIKSKGGHVIAIMGVDDSGNVLFADYVFNTDSHDSGKYYEPTSTTFYDKKMSLEEFYDTYGGNTSTYKGDDQRNITRLRMMN